MRKTTNFRDVVRNLSAISILLALFTLVFTFNACSGDDDDEEDDTESWYTYNDDSDTSEDDTSNDDNNSSNGSSSSGSSSSTTNKSHASIDLGLSVKWATMNVGASSPEDYGNYYAWGETSTKSNYCDSYSVTWGRTMSDISGKTTYDAATANWGNSWRMPTKNECQELVDNCSLTLTTQNGVSGYLCTGPNGNSIFLPAAGSRNGTSLNRVGSYGLYWSSTPESDDYSARFLVLYSKNFEVAWNFRCYGCTIRPVSD